jgi:chemotaxis protein CheD
VTATAPGQIFFSRTPARAVAVLGSCVAVALWDPQSGAGGMNHYLLPRWLGGAETAKYGDVANLWLLGRFERAGIPVARLRARLFGGACVMKPLCDRPNPLSAQNVAAAREFLAAHAIPIDEEHVEGDSGLRVVFDTTDGTASVRRLRQ